MWLTADAGTLSERMAADEVTPGRKPSLTGRGSEGEVGEMLEIRKPLYRGVADAAVDTTARGVEGVAEEICRLVAER